MALIKVGVGAVVFRDACALVVRRGKPPFLGQWSIPGGGLDYGETIEAAIVREVREETGVEVRPLDVMLVFDRIERRDGDVQYHYVIVDYRCDYVSGEAKAASDAQDAAWVAEHEIDGYDLPDLAKELVLRALRDARA